MYYIIGDIHGCLTNLAELFSRIKERITGDDTIIFLGDYIDRGAYSYEVITFLIAVSRQYNTVFLKGNHEDMFLKYLEGRDRQGVFLENGGAATLKSYRRKNREFSVPDEHLDFFKNLAQYYEGDDFISVHAGFNPKVYNIEAQTEEDTLWIREAFYRSQRRWEKSIIFGHTTTFYLNGHSERVHFDDKRNIIGIDTGAVYGGVLTCLRWPDRAVFQC